MNDIRARFEEIWPVPEGLRWDDRWGYLPTDPDSEQQINASVEHDTRLDTFTRCQETTSLYAGIIDDMIGDMELINDVSTDLHAIGIARESIGRAKQKLEQIK